jgi:DNA-binding Lrp family transcriptional regulator
VSATTVRRASPYRLVGERVPRAPRRPNGPDYHHWSDADDAVVSEMYQRGDPVAGIAAAIGASVQAVRNRVKKLALLRVTGLEKQFWRYVNPEPNCGCWLWSGSCSRLGYGELRVAGRSKRATHVALELDGRPVPRGMHACHSCDFPPCVNPAHLFIGTHKENMADSAAKGRASKPPISQPGQGVQEFCLRGHPLFGDNLYVGVKGRHCRECVRFHKRAYRARLAAAGLTTRRTPRVST